MIESPPVAASARSATQESVTAPTAIRQRRWPRWIWRLVVLLAVIPIVQVATLRFVDPPVTSMMIFRMFDHLIAGERITWSHTNLSNSEISPHIYSAVIAGEDQRFFLHRGFDMVEIEKAQRSHARHAKRPMRGASTITQQVAKNLFLPPWHSFVRKGVEAYYTVLIELMWPKERILQMYANIAEFGSNVYGAEEGALLHFHRHAKDLTQQQAAQMAAVLPNPVRWSASHPTAYIQRRASRIIRQMRGIPTDEEEDGEPD